MVVVVVGGGGGVRSARLCAAASSTAVRCAQVDRLAFSCIWEVDAEANILSSRYEKTVIRSAGALSYDEAQARLDDTRLDDPLTASLRILNTLAKQLKARRMAAGALVLGSPEVCRRLRETYAEKRIHTQLQG